MKKSLRFSLGSLLVLVAIVAAFLGGRYQRKLQQPNYVLDRQGGATSIQGDFVVTGQYVGEKSFWDRNVTWIQVHDGHILLEMGQSHWKLIQRNQLVQPS